MSNNIAESRNVNYHYAPIAYHDSWISVDPIIGCRLNCQYCYMQMTSWTGVKPQITYTISEIVDLLLNYKYFIPHQSVISFANQTDSFLQENVPLALEFFDALESQKLRNPLVIVTKKTIPDYFIQKMLSLRYIRPVFFLSYSALPRDIEKGVNPEENRKNFQTLFDNKLRVVHFWRPLLEINGTAAILEEVLDFVVRYSLASVYIGIKLNPHLIPIYDKNRLLNGASGLSEIYGDYIPPGVEKRLRTLAERKYPDYPLYLHTSCAVSLALSIPDYNATVYRDSICKNSECPSWKREICRDARYVPSEDKVASLLSKIGLNCDYKITNDAVYLLCDVNQDDYNFLLHQLNYPLSVKGIGYNRILRGSIFRRHSDNLSFIGDNENE